MTRIEISLDEYEVLKSENDKVFKENIDLKKQNELLQQKNEEILTALDNIKESSLIERIFKWKKLYNYLSIF